MANTDNAKGLLVCRTEEAPVLMVCKTGETLAVGDPVENELGAGTKLATSSSEFIYGVVVPQENASGVMKGPGENLFTTSTAAQTFWIQRARPNTTFLMQCSGNTAALKMGDHCDIEGSTGGVECDENAESTKVVEIVKVFDGPCRYHNEITALGANGIVEVLLVQHRAI